MGEHRCQVDPAGSDHVQEVGDAVLTHALDLLDPEGVGARIGDLLGVHRRVVPLGGAVHAQLHKGPPGTQHAAANLQRLGCPDRVVDHVDATRKGHREPVCRLQHAARPVRDPLDELKSRLVGNRRCPEALGQPALRFEPGDRHHLDSGVQRPQDRDGALAERAGTVDEHLASRLRRMAGDSME